MNIVLLVGNIGKDPALHKTTENRVCKFTLAVSRQNRGVLWVYCECWNELADLVMAHVKKGRKVTIAGELDSSTFTGKDGAERTVTYIKCRNVQWDSTKAKADPSADPGMDQTEGW